MRLSVASDTDWDRNWIAYDLVELSDEESRIEQDQQGRIEDRIANAIGDEYYSGFDWAVQHFDTPAYVFSLTLQNSDLFRWDLIERTQSIVFSVSPRWTLNLGLVDAIHDGIWNSSEDLVTFFLAKDSGLYLQHRGFDKLPANIRRQISERTENRAEHGSDGKPDTVVS